MPHTRLLLAVVQVFLELSFVVCESGFLHGWVDDLVPFVQLLLSEGFALCFRPVTFDLDEIDAFSVYLGPQSCVDTVGPGAGTAFPPVCADDGTAVDDETEGRVYLCSPPVKDRGDDPNDLLGHGSVPGCL